MAIQSDGTEQAESSHVIFKIQDSIVYVIYKKGVTIDLEAAKEIGQLRRNFLKGRSYPGLADVRYLKVVTRDARKFLEKEATLGVAESGVTVIALLVRNRVTVFLANVFMKFVKPKIPTRVFITKEAALGWLEQFKNKDSP